MGEFLRAAIRILREAGKPLHVKEITRIALDQALVETTGQTPERTMSTELRRDIQTKGEKSRFILTGQATFAINPKYSVVDEKRTAIEEQETEAEIEKEIISQQYIGKGGEHLVQSELLFRGYNASIMPVDEGMDIVATKGKNLFNLQVKTSQEQNGKHNIHVTVSSFKKHSTSGTFYVFVLRGKAATESLIFPYNILLKFIEEGDVVTDSTKKKYRIQIISEDGKHFLGQKRHDIAYYIDRWDLIR